MAKGPVFKPVFKAYHQRQAMLLPPSLEELIPLKHPVRVVDEVLSKINIQPLINCYVSGGAASYHPGMLLKVLVYAYINNIYSSRKIEEALQQNIHFMWLSGMSTPDHNTINRFRGEKLRESLKKIFVQVVQLLAAEGLVSLKELYTDGTKIEANANRYTFVWGNTIKHNKAKMKQQLDELWKHVQSIARAEDDDTDPTDFKEITKENMEAAIDQINESIKNNPDVDKKIQQKLKYAKATWPAALDRYEAQEKIMGKDRNSYSKTDPDATFMRMKEDHLNGQLKAAYNLQISSNNQYITQYSLHNVTTDTVTLKEHVHDFEKDHGFLPEALTADAGYGSEENYDYLEKKGITAFVKYNQFDREQKEITDCKKPFTADKLYYNEEQDYYVCPMGQRMANTGKTEKLTSTGFKQILTKYEATNCNGCPLNGACHKSKGNRIIEINNELIRLKQQASQRLLSEEGIKKRKQRCHDVETIFGNIKNNHGFRRFMLRGKQKVQIEVGILAIAHNLRKKAA